MGKKKKAEPPVEEILAGYAATLLQAVFIDSEESSLSKVNELLSEEEVQDIIDACLRQDRIVDVVELINQTNELAAGRTALQYAAVKGHVNVTKRLIEAQANPNVSCRYGFTPLHLASQLGNTEVIRELFEAEANPNTKDHVGETPLHSAAQAGHTEAAYQLLHGGADLSVVNWDGRSALHTAVQYQKAAVVELLIQSGADTTLRDRDGITPMQVEPVAAAPGESTPSPEGLKIATMISSHDRTRQCQQNIRRLQAQGRGGRYPQRQSPPTSPSDNSQWDADAARVPEQGSSVFLTQ